MAGLMLPAVGRPVPLSLHVVFRSQGIKWPLRDWDRIEVRDAGTHVLYFEITGELLKTLLRHHLDGLAVQALMKERLEGTFQPKIGEEPMPEMNPADQTQRERFRAERLARDRRRKPPRKMLFPAGVSYALAHSCPAAQDIADLFWLLYVVMGGWT